MSFENVEKSVRRSTIFAAIIIIIIPSSYIFWFYLKNDYSLSLDSSVWGSFGDFIGGILNPLMALLAFYWLTQSVLIQKRELQDTKNALVSSSESQQQQVMTQEKKRFEDTFFSLLEQHNNVLEKLEHTFVIGNRVSQSNIARIKNSLSTSKGNKSILDVKDEFHKNHNPVCGHYFRILYQLLKLIATNLPNSSISKNFLIDEIKEKSVTVEEKIYSNILRSFLSYDMTKVLAINCICDSSTDTYYKYKLLIERYNFLEHMPLDDELSIEAIKYYDKKAFGNSGFLIDYKKTES